MDSYYRQALISYELFRQWLGLPEGFEIDGIEHDVERRALRLRVRCSAEERFHVSDAEPIPLLGPAHAHFNEAGIIDRIWWPELGDDGSP